jgi:hypothetical protein
VELAECVIPELAIADVAATWYSKPSRKASLWMLSLERGRTGRARSSDHSLIESSHMFPASEGPRPIKFLVDVQSACRLGCTLLAPTLALK